MKEADVSPELIAACLKQERKAQNMLYRKTYARLMNICRRYAKNSEDARELFIIGFMKILDNLGKYRTDMPFESWISRVMINAIIDNLRSKERFNEHHTFTETNVLEYKSDSDYNEYEKQINTDEALNMLRLLPNATRQVFALFAIDEYTHKEIAQVLGISENTSKWHVSEARKKLQKILENNFKTAKV